MAPLGLRKARGWDTCKNYLMEPAHASGKTLWVVLARHPKLTSDLRRPAMQEIGFRGMVFRLQEVKGR
jgi:type II secretory pathway predicted ATPase ExeA